MEYVVKLTIIEISYIFLSFLASVSFFCRNVKLS